MFVILGCIQHQHDLHLLLAALAMSLFTCATARAMVVRGRAGEGTLRAVWLVSAGAVFGTGVWATHFVAMLAYNIGLPMNFDPAITLLSAASAIILSVAGFALRLRRGGSALGGAIVGLAVVVMHYQGMAALELPATAVWNQGIVLSSVVIGLSLASLAGHVAALPVSRATNITTVALGMLAILGMHFTAMGAVRFVPANVANWHHDLWLSPPVMAIVVLAATGFVIGQALVLAVVDGHLAARAQGEALRLRNHIIELEAARSELSVALDAANAASRSKSAFLASMSHELRTPLNAVIGFSESMLCETFGPLGAPRYKEYANDIRTSGHHLLSLINDILDIARSDAGQSELNETLFGPADEVNDTMRMMQPQAARAKVTLRAEVASGLPAVTADQRRIRQILLNLMSNALKFTPPGGNVTVRAYLTPAGLCFEVADTGIGIAPRDFAKALEPFGQVDSSLARKYEGTGLGLPLTRQLAELHGGSLTLHSMPGHGTTVTVTLPAWRLSLAAAA